MAGGNSYISIGRGNRIGSYAWLGVVGIGGSVMNKSIEVAEGGNMDIDH